LGVDDTEAPWIFQEGDFKGDGRLRDGERRKRERGCYPPIRAASARVTRVLCPAWTLRNYFRSIVRFSLGLSISPSLHLSVFTSSSPSCQQYEIAIIDNAAAPAMARNIGCDQSDNRVLRRGDITVLPRSSSWLSASRSPLAGVQRSWPAATGAVFQHVFRTRIALFTFLAIAVSMISPTPALRRC